MFVNFVLHLFHPHVITRVYLSDSILLKEELRRNSILASQKVQFKEFQMDGITSYGVSTDRFRSSSPANIKDDNLKSYVSKPVNLHVRQIIF